MSELTLHPIPENWTIRPTLEFATHVGPFYEPQDAGNLVCGFRPDHRHANKRGVVHGGMIATAFDVGLGNAAWHAAEQQPCATIQLNIHYLGALNLGEFAVIRAHIVRATRTLVFLRGEMHVEDRPIAAADGVWKRLTWRGEAFKPR